MVRGYAKLWLLVTCQVHEAGIEIAGENSAERKTSVEVEHPVRAGQIPHVFRILYL